MEVDEKSEWKETRKEWRSIHKEIQINSEKTDFKKKITKAE